jgi:hypothetical protein
MEAATDAALGSSETHHSSMRRYAARMFVYASVSASTPSSRMGRLLRVADQSPRWGKSSDCILLNESSGIVSAATCRLL